MTEHVPSYCQKTCTQRQLSSNVCNILQKMLQFHIFPKAQTDPHKNDTQLGEVKSIPILPIRKLQLNKKPQEIGTS